MLFSSLDVLCTLAHAMLPFVAFFFSFFPLLFLLLFLLGLLAFSFTTTIPHRDTSSPIVTGVAPARTLAENGTDISSEQTLQISITPVNDAPSFRIDRSVKCADVRDEECKCPSEDSPTLLSSACAMSGAGVRPSVSVSVQSVSVSTA